MEMTNRDDLWTCLTKVTDRDDLYGWVKEMTYEKMTTDITLRDDLRCICKRGDKGR